MLITQSFKDVLGRVPLLFWIPLICLEALINDPSEAIKLRATHGVVRPVARRNRKSQHLGISAWINPE